VIVYGAKISYFTGKFEAYLRYREIPYEYRPLDARLYRSVVPDQLGATQYPTVQLDDGRWMSDTTPMIAWLEQREPGPAVFPASRCSATSRCWSRTTPTNGFGGRRCSTGG
jgi:glutathione S-transferase